MQQTGDDAGRFLGHEPALDGIRGIAVLLVVLWHYPPDILERQFSWLKAGHLGVDLFFVLSGFLITALLLNEHRRSGAVSYRGFYRRRVFRLLPALALFLVGHIIWANLTDLPPGGFIPGTDGVDQWASVIGAAFFGLNWIGDIGDWRITLGMAHLWSLSVEEQFYIVWPTVFVLTMSPRKSLNQLAAGLTSAAAGYAAHVYVWESWETPVRTAATVLLVGAVFAVLEVTRRSDDRTRWALAIVGTIILATLLYRNGHYEGGFEIFRLYSGTPGRVDSLMVGAGFALLWSSGRIPRRCPTPVALAGWAVFVWAVTTKDFASPFFFRYGWTVIAVAVTLTIWAALGAEGTVYGRVLSFAPLRAVGKVAYGLYLWHALVFIAVRHWWSDGSVAWKTFLALGITAAITSASWFLVEKPLLRFKNPARPSEAPPEPVVDVPFSGWATRTND